MGRKRKTILSGQEKAQTSPTRKVCRSLRSVVIKDYLFPPSRCRRQTNESITLNMITPFLRADPYIFIRGGH